MDAGRNVRPDLQAVWGWRHSPTVWIVGAWTAAAIVSWVLSAWVPLPEALVLFLPSIAVTGYLAGMRVAGAAAAAGLAGGVTVFPAAEWSSATFVLVAGLGLSVALGTGWAFREQARRAAALRDLTQREAQLTSIFDAAPDGMIVIDEQGVMQRFSAAASRIFGWSSEEAVGRNVEMLMPSPYREEHAGHLEHYQKTGERRIIGVGRIVSGQRKNGETFPMELAVGELRGPHGRYFTGFVRDLTERVETQERLQELNNELIHMSRFSAMGEMASALAHELNQPLGAIANYLSGARRLLEQDRAPGERAIEAMEKAREQALRAGEIIRRLRQFLANGQSERSAENLSKLIQEACGLAMVGASEQGVRAYFRLESGLGRVMVDKVQIQQVVVNLVRNALDAMANQTRRELVVSTALGEDGMAVVSVADTGAGLDAAARERLFQPFVSTKPGGMGIGLSISRTIVEAHGGRIWTEPNAGGGAVFRFTVPLESFSALAEAPG